MARAPRLGRGSRRFESSHLDQFSKRKNKMSKLFDLAIGVGLAYIGVVLLLIAGWLTHVIVTIQTAKWILLLAGAILFPIGIIHGWGIWFGIF